MAELPPKMTNQYAGVLKMPLCILHGIAPAKQANKMNKEEVKMAQGGS